MNRINLLVQLARNMGWKYLLFRIRYEIKRKLGFLKLNFPTNPSSINCIPLEKWRKDSKPFLFESRKNIHTTYNSDDLTKLEEESKRVLNGEIFFFNSQWKNIGNSYDWVTNPDTGHQYSIHQHWTEIEDLNKEAGDIKYVWEKSRFSYLHSIIRYDQASGKDHSSFAFEQIEDWIDHNPINSGPNYKCSQEISIRVLNWIFILYYYKHCKSLSEHRFRKIMNAIYWQVDHVYKNIDFSRIAVRNNHAITECLTLYIIGLLFPDWKQSSNWKLKGKKWFEEEIKYQIADDGSYIQQSMNYQRVVIQLLTWGIAIAESNSEKFAEHVYDRAYSCLNFLYQVQDDITGWLPNYGANDGALFFKLSNSHYRDYRPQLNALHWILTGLFLYKDSICDEEIEWYAKRKIENTYPALLKKDGILAFDNGGYYIFREKNTFAFIRCAKFTDRPGQADNLHLDIWHNGENILLDAGSFKYNAEEKWIAYFSGTESHNTVMLGIHNQMKKGPRFIWFNWSKAISAKIIETETEYIFTGEISCYTFLNRKCKHRRKVIKKKNENIWIIEDEISNNYNRLDLRQLWHTKSNNINFQTSGDSLAKNTGYYSSLYGIMEESQQVECISNVDAIKTTITIPI